MVDKLGLRTTPYPRPYKFQRLSEDGELVVNKQVLVNFSIGKYHDEVLCDVVPMEDDNIFLGRPWQFDWIVNRDGLTNKFMFVNKNLKITLVPLSPREVYEDQIKLRVKRDEERKVLKGKEK